MGKLYKENWYQKWQKEANLDKFPKLYRYRYRAVPVQPNRSQIVLVQVQGCTGTPQQNATCTGIDFVSYKL